MTGVSGPAPAGVTAVVLTHMRPRLATSVVRSLLATEGFDGRHVVVVVNGTGGLDDPELEATVRMVRLPRNLGPAGGFGAGMEAAFSDPGTAWAYLCEDDVGLFSLPAPRVAGLLDRLESYRSERPVGAAVAYGRRFVGRGAHTVNVVPPVDSPVDLQPVDLHPVDVHPVDLQPVDVACWGATLVSRRVWDAGVAPDPRWFFGLEDFDFFCRVRAAGLEVVVDSQAARAVAGQQTSAGRHQAIGDERPNDDEEAWRAYYHARNSIELARRHGRPTWHAWHAAYSLHRLQLASSRRERLAILHGLWDGGRRRLGEHPRYGRRVGEFGDR